MAEACYFHASYPIKSQHERKRIPTSSTRRTPKDDKTVHIPRAAAVLGVPQNLFSVPRMFSFVALNLHNFCWCGNPQETLWTEFGMQKCAFMSSSAVSLSFILVKEMTHKSLKRSPTDL